MAIALLVGLVPLAPARAQTTEEQLREARRELTRVQGEADELAARYEVAYTRQAELETEVLRLRADLEAKESEARVLRRAVNERAATAYKQSGSLAFVPALFEPDILAMERRVRLFENANAVGNETLDRLGAVTEDLGVRREQLDAALADQRVAVDQLARDSAELQDRLEAMQELRSRLEDELAAEEAAARAAAAAERARQEAEARRLAELRRNQQQDDDDPDTTPTPDADIVCPIRGAVSFVDSWGAPRSGGRRHQGVDLMSPFGTPNVAVVSGTVSHKSGNLSGLGVYLYGDDGNTYYYFHLQSYEGSGGRVEQGEVVGYTGDTGNAQGGAPHTHFEYHPGGGAAVNPYPLVRPVC
ncbi:MAG TPA: peptidoglycan DD-metalloendopeptidase family protein [Acidimicrobiia bacterium]|nr:peptidoglycan DD-metalloendopeptidase family protein [Acidimicrobiia bacterium]